MVFLEGLILGTEVTNNGVLERLITGTPHYHMWFLYMMVGLYLFPPFFFLGYLIRQQNWCPSIIVLLGVFLFSLILTSVGCYILAVNKDLATGMCFYGFLSVSVIPMSISAIYILKKLDVPFVNKRLTQKLSMLTLGVYLVHPMFLEMLNFIRYGAESFHPLISIPLITCVVFFASITATWSISRIPYLRNLV